MRTENSVLMKQAREALAGKWGLAVGTSLAYIIITSAAQYIPKIGWAISILITGAMVLGFTTFSLSLSRNQNPRFEQLFEGFNRFGVSLVAYLLMTLFILLWSLLLIIPGIIAGFFVFHDVLHSC